MSTTELQRSDSDRAAGGPGGPGDGRGPRDGLQPGDLGPRELARWTWRQLTSMRTALLLLLLLALAAVPGSIIPQTGVDAFAVGRWKDDHPQLTPIYEALGLFDVYSSPWFTAVYVLLMVSLVGCIVPRMVVYAKALRARPPRAPKRLGRLPHSATLTLPADADGTALEEARRVLRGRSYRVVADEGDAAGASSLAAERGKLREAGNLVFHVSVVVVLVAVAFGGLFGYKAGAIIPVGQTFSDQVSQFDDFVPGALFDPADLPPYSFTVDNFDVDWIFQGAAAGQPEDFRAALTTTAEPGAEPQQQMLKVNEPISFGSSQVYLVGHGYAPVFTVRDGNGDVAFSGAVPFLPSDQTFASIGVVKVPDARPTQLGFEGGFYPTYDFTMERGPFSRFPAALDPVVSLQVYEGDLGLDGGDTQSVYVLDKDNLNEIDNPDSDAPFRVDMVVGQTKQIPGGLGSITYDGVERYVKLQMASSPGAAYALAGVVVGLAGLMLSLYIRPRRAWVRLRPAGDAPGGADGPYELDVAVLDRTEGGDPRAELEELVTALTAATGGTLAQPGVGSGQAATSAGQTHRADGDASQVPTSSEESS
ncbi:cytochrome c biogenesis protein ResB [Nocardioidaceae bacterium]|nr:cytochrome c biogenesis protein ResB [Nocardioidaceae bacterium]